MGACARRGRTVVPGQKCQQTAPMQRHIARRESGRRGVREMGVWRAYHRGRVGASVAAGESLRGIKKRSPKAAFSMVRALRRNRAMWRNQLKKLLSLSVQLLPLGEWREPPFLSESSSSRSSLRWCSVSLTGVSTTMWQYRSPG